MNSNAHDNLFFNKKSWNSMRIKIDDSTVFVYKHTIIILSVIQHKTDNHKI